MLETSIKANASMDDPHGQKIDIANVRLGTGYSKYNEDARQIIVKTSVEVGCDDGNELPFSLRVELVGIFIVDESQFPIVHIEKWAKGNAPLILYPFLREHVYGLTSRAGFDGMLLPLLEIPTFKVNYQY